MRLGIITIMFLGGSSANAEPTAGQAASQPVGPWPPTCLTEKPARCLADARAHAKAGDHGRAFVSAAAAFLRGVAPAFDAAMRAGTASKSDLGLRTALTAACEKQLLACAVLGTLWDASQKPAQATAAYKKACDGGEMAGCSGLASQLLEKKTARDAKQAHALYQNACEKNYHPACYYVATIHLLGKGVPKNLASARSYLQRACKADVAVACHDLGVLHYNKGDPSELAAAARLYQQACDLELISSCYNLGLMYRQGVGVTRDTGKALALQKRGCDADEAQACSEIGNMIQGNEVDGTPADAVRAFDKACTIAAIGCDTLGGMYNDGRGVPQDAARAARYFELSCNAGRPSGCSNLGLMYASGRGVLKDRKKAAALLGKACKGGLAPACNNLRWLRSQGQ